MKRKRPETGEIYRHFRGKRYRVLCIAVSTETKEEMVVYEPLSKGKIYVSTLLKFLGAVDREKYPEADQKFRFELCSEVCGEKENTGTEDNQGIQSENMSEEHRLILEFLELEDNEEKIRFLQRRRAELTDRFLTAAAESVEYAESAGAPEERYAGLLRFLQTKAKYESRRLRGNTSNLSVS